MRGGSFSSRVRGQPVRLAGDRHGAPAPSAFYARISPSTVGCRRSRNHSPANRRSFIATTSDLNQSRSAPDQRFQRILKYAEEEADGYPRDESGLSTSCLASSMQEPVPSSSGLAPTRLRAATGCARNAGRDSGSAQISCRPHTATSPSPRMPHSSQQGRAASSHTFQPEKLFTRSATYY
jgi:hypothetical protein